MRLSDINPYIRYANRFDFSPDSSYVYTYDCRMFYIAGDGCGICIGSERYNVENGTLVMFPSGTRYRFMVDKKINMIVLNFDFTQRNADICEVISPVKERRYNKERLLEHSEFSDCSVLNSPIIIKNAEFAKNDLQKISDEYNTQKILYKEKCSGMLKKLIAEAVREASVPPSCASDKIDILVEFIRNNYQNKIDNGQLGEMLGYHPYYLNRLMLAHTGTTFHQYLLNHRIDSAKRFLANTDMTVTEIAAKCGFANVSYFSNSFKAKVGMSPLRFRRGRKNLV